MIDGKKVLAWIPARGGSKGIKDKNIKQLQDKPLIAYTIDAARNSKYVDRVMVSTDSPKIAQISSSYGAWTPFLRPEALAADTSKTIDAVMHTIQALNDMDEFYPIFCLLQPTSPLRASSDIDSALEMYINKGCRSIAAVSLVRDHPILIRTIDSDGRMIPLLNRGSTCRRQDMPHYYRINGSIYINNSAELSLETSFNDNEIPYVMEESHSVDIDELSDFAMAEYWIKAASL